MVNVIEYLCENKDVYERLKQTIHPARREQPWTRSITRS